MFIKENKESKNITEVSNRTGKMVTTPPGAVRMECFISWIQDWSTSLDLNRSLNHYDIFAQWDAS